MVFRRISGKYFDPRYVSEPDLSRYVQIGKKGGLGIFMMRRLLDDIDYRKTEAGNELWLTKKRVEPEHKGLHVSSIPLSLKMRYWLYAMGILSVILVGVYFYMFFNQKQNILHIALEQGKNSCTVLRGEVQTNWENLDDPSLLPDLRDDGSEDVRVWLQAQRPVNTIKNSEQHENVVDVLVVDKSQRILASYDKDKVAKTFSLPEDASEFTEHAYLYELENGQRVMDIVMPVRDPAGSGVLAHAHYQIDYDTLYTEINEVRSRYLRGVLLVALIGAAGLFLLIYLVMNPFQRLQEWVKRLGQPGVIEEMDIDDTTEVGSIAKAFSDITIKLRESQVNLAEQERLQQEMQVAKEIQQTLLPAEFPQVTGYDISSYYGAAKEVGGDYYDFIEVDKDTLGIVVADVSGKGVPGSLVMTMIRTALRTEARGVKDAAEVLSRVNDFVVNDMKKGMFVTLFYVIVDSRRRRLNYASAGHNPMILYRPTTQKTYYLNPRGFPIGISLPDKQLFRKSLESDTIALAEDDVLIVYTDGVTEAMNPQRELFGDERFLETIRNYGSQNVNDFVNNIKKELQVFTEDWPQNDDITLVALKEETTVEKIEFERAKKVYVYIEEGKNVKEACELAGLSSYAYYNKYKELFESEGVETFKVSSDAGSIELRHLSIEERTKIYDVIQRHPEYGAKRISEELNSERYHFTKLKESRIYDELVRMRLNTKELREAFVARGGKRKKRMKAPGTPMMTINGKVIVQKDDVQPAKKPTQERILSSKKQEPKKPEAKPKAEPVKSTDVFQYDEKDILTQPLEDLLADQSLIGEGPKKTEEQQPAKSVQPEQPVGKEQEEAPHEKEPVLEQEEKEPDIFSELDLTETFAKKTESADEPPDEAEQIFHNWPGLILQVRKGRIREKRNTLSRWMKRQRRAKAMYLIPFWKKTVIHSRLILLKI
ncbi:MAG: SpoIIE family protein phosphatase [candidate division KSB1 bacterium]|nr:SpoIIE family protein phosphatase [candidate division KSB1 bacterium]